MPTIGGSQPAGGGPLARPAAGGSTIPSSYEVPPPMACGSTCTVASWLIVRPPAAGEPAHGAPPPPRAPGLEAPADLAGRSAPGEVGHDTGPQNRVGIEGALLGTGASACGHAPRLLAPVAPVGARVALDPAPDHRRGPAEHSGDARLTTQTPAPHRSQPGPTRSKADDNPHPTPLNQENRLHPMTPPSALGQVSGHWGSLRCIGVGY